MATNAEHPKPSEAPVSQHLTVRPPGTGPVEVPFLFERRDSRVGGAAGASLAFHGGLVLLYMLAVWLAPDNVRQAILPDLFPAELVWLVEPGPGGGGGGGNKMPEPPKKAEIPGKEKMTVPAEKKPEPDPEVKEKPPEQMNIPAQTLAAATDTSPGVILSNEVSASTGSGVGTGGGAGQGSGLGAGTGGGTGGGAYRIGNGVEPPQIISQVRPQYTAEAMRAKVQGVALLECVVQSNGTVGTCEISRSLDSNFGLDQEALKAAKQWRFRPGTRFGEPVAVLVTIEMTFTLR